MKCWTPIVVRFVVVGVDEGRRSKHSSILLANGRKAINCRSEISDVFEHVAAEHEIERPNIRGRLRDVQDPVTERGVDIRHGELCVRSGESDSGLESTRSFPLPAPHFKDSAR